MENKLILGGVGFIITMMLLLLNLMFFTPKYKSQKEIIDSLQIELLKKQLHEDTIIRQNN